MNPFRWTFRAQCLFAFAVCAALLAFAVYMQLKVGLVPCPLCIFQRIAFTATGVVFLIAGLHAPRGAFGQRAYALLALLAALIGVGIAGRHVWIQHLPPDQVPACGPGLDYLRELLPLSGVIGQRIYSALALIAAGVGVGIAGRHVWLQHLPPDQVPSCGPGLDYMRELMPLTSVIRKVLTGSGECARVDWTLFGLSMAEWGLVWFLLLALWAAWLTFRRRRSM